MSKGISEFPAQGIGKLLADSRFVVPNHQRDYSWTEDEVTQLFDDVDDAIARGDNFYFLGLMVFMESDDAGDDALVVLDGQQRLATAVLFLSAARNWLQQSSQHQEDAKQIQYRFIGSAELGEQTVQAKLVLNAANNETFTAYVVKSVPVDEIRTALAKLKKSDRNRRLLEAALVCHERVAKIVAASGSSAEAAERLLRIAKYIRDSASVARLIVSSEGVAFTIFETLNDRGLELAPLDLVKNYLFGRAERHSKPRIRDMEERWAQMMNTLASVKPAAFLKAFWTSRHGRVQMHYLFGLLKQQYQDAESVVQLSIDMLATAEQYVAIESPDDAVWAPFPPSTRQTIRSLKIFASQSIPGIILAALARFDARELDRLLRLLEVLIVRFQLIGGGRTGMLEIACARLAQAIYKREVQDAAGALRNLADVYPSDTEFQAAFFKKEEPSNTKLQYLLRGLESEERRLAAGPMARETDPGQALSVEHILPRSPGPDWKSVIDADPGIVDECGFRIGNTCLLTMKVNRDFGQAGFDVKRQLYGRSDLITTRQVADAAIWDRKAISARQAHMAKLAVTAWRFQ